MKFIIPPIIVALLLIVIFHIIGFKTKGKFSKYTWKKGDYIWLSLAIFSLLSASGELRIENAKREAREIQLERLNLAIQSVTGEYEIYERIKQAKGRNILYGENNDLSQYKYENKDLERKIEKAKNRYIEIKNDQIAWDVESFFKGIYPLFLAIAFSIRITMTSAEVLNWYRR
jgi:hypothetical protein